MFNIIASHKPKQISCMFLHQFEHSSFHICVFLFCITYVQTLVVRACFVATSPNVQLRKDSLTHCAFFCALRMFSSCHFHPILSIFKNYWTNGTNLLHRILTTEVVLNAQRCQQFGFLSNQFTFLRSTHDRNLALCQVLSS